MSTTKPCFANTANSVGRLGLGANGSYKELYQHFGITAVESGPMAAALDRCELIHCAL
jgi:hypothetical protein